MPRDKLLYRFPASFLFEVVLRNGNRVVIKSTDSVAALFYLRDLDQVVLAKEHRAALEDEFTPDGMSYGTVAGRFDLEIGVTGLVVKEADEEIGAQIMEHDVILLNHGRPLGKNPGLNTERTFLAIVVIDSEQLRDGLVFGAADEGERIERSLVSIADLEEMVYDDLTLWGLCQFLQLHRQTLRDGGAVPGMIIDAT